MALNPKRAAFIREYLIDLNATQAAIRAADLPPDIRAFLQHAAERHTMFHFDLIANYYAHATPDVQALMEASALVIIDFNQAIERGFVKLDQSIRDAFSEEYPDHEAG